jgi:hypothetical protein
MDVIGIISVVIAVIGLIGALITPWIAMHNRVSKIEGDAKVCSSKHDSNEKNWAEQHKINVRADERHTEIVGLLSTTNAKIDILLEDRKNERHDKKNN